MRMEVHHQWCLCLMMPYMCTPVRCVDRRNHVSLLVSHDILFLLQNLQSLIEPDSEQPHQESDDEEAAAEKREVSCELCACNSTGYRQGWIQECRVAPTDRQYIKISSICEKKSGELRNP